MKKILLLALFSVTLLFLISSESSYSFFKKMFLPEGPRPARPAASEKGRIEDIEDMIYIPEIKSYNFKEAFLKKISREQYIEIVIPENILYFYRLNHKANAYQLVRKYPVSIGKPRTQTPVGEGVIYTKGHILFKYQYGPKAGQVITVGHDEFGGEFPIPYESMFGLYMIVNQSERFVIHSTTEYWTTGGAVSGGCVRLLIPDMLDLYPLVAAPIRVKIRYELFRRDSDLVTVYPDVYHRSSNLYHSLMEFFRSGGVNPIIFSADKIKKVLFGDLPETLALDEILDDYFVSRNIRFRDIRLDYRNFLSEEKSIKIDAFYLQNKQ